MDVSLKNYIKNLLYKLEMLQKNHLTTLFINQLLNKLLENKKIINYERFNQIMTPKYKKLVFQNDELKEKLEIKKIELKNYLIEKDNILNEIMDIIGEDKKMIKIKLI